MSVTVVGDAFVDVIVPAQAARPGETHYGRVIASCGGTANVAVLISELGEQARFIGKVGNDVFGKHFRRNLKQVCVDDLTLTDHKNRTGLCVSLVYPDGERTMIADRGANDHLTIEEIDRFLDTIMNSTIIYFSGYSFVSALTSESILYAMRACRSTCEIWFNPGAPNIIHSSFNDYISEYVDVLILNLDEAKVLSGRRAVEEMAGELRSTVDLAAVTLGQDGCILVTSDGYTHVPARDLGQVRDTTGAGDAFAAGFIVGKLRGLNVIESAELGNRTAFSFIEQRGETLK